MHQMSFGLYMLAQDKRKSWNNSSIFELPCDKETNTFFLMSKRSAALLCLPVSLALSLTNLFSHHPASLKVILPD